MQNRAQARQYIAYIAPARRSELFKCPQIIHDLLRAQYKAIAYVELGGALYTPAMGLLCAHA